MLEILYVCIYIYVLYIYILSIIDYYYYVLFKGRREKELIVYFTLDHALLKSRTQKLISYSTHSESVDANLNF